MLGPIGRNQSLSTGNESFDKFLGGGLLNASLNLFERHGPSARIIDVIINKSFAATTLIEKNALIYINFNTAQEVKEDELLSCLPSQRKVKSEVLYKDIKGSSAAAQIKIAWRYSNRGPSSPSDGFAKMDQIDFGVPLVKSVDLQNLGKIAVLNINPDEPLVSIISRTRHLISETKKYQQSVNVIIKDLLHPFSPLIDLDSDLLKFLYALRCFSRYLNKGAILVSYDHGLCTQHFNIQQQLYNLADSVVVFNSYETDENIRTGYRDIDGTLMYVKVPKINSYGFHFQQDISDWGYRLTRNYRYLVIDELSLPPSEGDNDDGKGRQIASDVTRIESTRRPLENVGPLEEFREVAQDVIARKLS